MGWFGSDSNEAQAFDQYNNLDMSQPEHKAKVSHELIGGAAAFEAMKAWEDHCASNGKPDSHAKAKEILAGLAGAIVDREFETKGLDFIDKERAKRHAQDQLEAQVAQEY